ncbi:hypothetical protein [uncultured Alsobacter sp.]|uniref:hypothetical protein n=1 Tax=uncultured Alsobacter sp. TaxID=1748258 RepID=UPI0025CD3BD0|nr:hypothetical protein [uncultured Alsobacter sp.]
MRQNRTHAANGLERLDRFIGDALIGAMLLLGFVFCVAAARADDELAPPPPVAVIAAAKPA